MKTTQITNIPPLSEMESKILAFIASKDEDEKGAEVWEGEILARMFPPPIYPKNGTREQIDAWLKSSRAYNDRAYSGNGVKYADCYSHQCSLALIRLIQLKLIKEHNNGFNVGFYSLNG